MDRFGFTNLQQYSDAYRQAVKESLAKGVVDAHNAKNGGVVASNVDNLNNLNHLNNLNGFDKTLRLRDDLVAKGLLLPGHHGNHHHHALPTGINNASLPSLPSLDLSHLSMPSAKRFISFSISSTSIALF